MTGGNTLDRGILRSCEYYCIKSEKWQDGPQIRQPRYNHSSCAQGDNIYLIGNGLLRTRTQTIEILNAEAFL